MWNRQTILPILFVLSLAPATTLAQDRTASFGGFGGMSVNSLNSVASFRPDFGINVARELTPNVQAIGEFGFLSDMLPSRTSSLISLTPYDFRVSAYYGEGGVRMLTGSGGGVNPYVEATAGIARLHPALSGVGSRWDPLAAAALNFLNTTEPILGFGGGLMLSGGPVVADLGYRYKKVVGSDAFADLLAAGGTLGAHQVRFGVGVRF
jgi:hypothetical protein